MNESEAEFKEKFMELVNNKKDEAGKTSSLMRIEKRERIIRCMQNPELEPNVKFRSRVRERKYRLLEENGEVYLGVPDETSGELIYRRAACVEEFWDIIHAAHVDNGHIGVVHTFNSIRGVYALLPRNLVSLYVKMCPVCAHMFKTPQKNKTSTTNTSASSEAVPVTAPVPFVNGNAETDAMKPAVHESQVVHPPDAAEGQGEDGSGNSEGDVTAPMEAEEEGCIGTSDEQPQNCESQAPTDISAVAAATPSSTSAISASNVRVVFTCHICDLSFEKKLFYQRHIRAHREHTPRIPFVSPYKTPAPFEKKRAKQERRSYTTVSRGRQVIIDGDMGVEACQALMLAVWRSDLLVVGVTCVSGAVNIEKACNNALQVLNVCDREDVQVFCGAERPLVKKKLCSIDSLPGPSWQTNMDNSEIKPEHAVSAMIRLVNEQPGKISIVCLGPLTNLALALRLDPNMAKKLKEVFILGGNIEGRGDSSICAEQNFHHDPEAAYAVLEEIPNITLLPYEVCDRHKLTGDFFDSWVHLGTSRSEFVRGMGDENWLKENQQNGYTPFCAYAMAIVADRTIALEKKLVYATVELSGDLCRGMMVVDWAKRLGKESNVQVVRSLDLGKIQSLLIGMVEDPEAMEVYTV